MSDVVVAPAVKPPWWFGIVKPTLNGFLRHGLTGLGGILVSVGAIQSNQTEQFVAIAAGIVSWLVGYIWSNYSGQVKKAALVQANNQTAALAEQNRDILAQADKVTGGAYKGDVPV